MGLLDFLKPAWDPARVTPPWDPSRRAIYDHVQAHLREDGPGLREGGETLPDEPPADDSQVRWAAGALDGVGTHHGGWAGGSEQIPQLMKALQDVLKRLDPGTLQAFYDLLVQEGAISLVDPLLDHVRQAASAGSLDTTRLWKLALWMAQRAPDREPVKVAMAILGMFTGKDHRETLVTLGRHDEFTLYAAVAMANTFDDPEEALLGLARNVEGWGRVHLVERLTPMASRPETKHWLLTEGHKNGVMGEYVGFACATGGRLHEALEPESVEPDILLGAGEILEILATAGGGPFQGLEAYAQGPLSVQRFLDHAERAPALLQTFLTCHALQTWAADPPDTEGDEASPWSQEEREEVGRRCEALLQYEHWRPLALEGLASPDRQAFFDADRAAGILGIDTWPIHLQRLREGNSDSWFSVARTTDPVRMAEVVALAEARLPLAAMASGPEMKMFGGALSNEFHALDAVVQALGSFAGLGWPLIRTAMRSPVIRARNMAIKALEGWGRENWPEAVPALLSQCLAAEPDESVRRRFDRLIRGVPTDSEEDT